MLEVLARYWWALTAGGVLAVALGVMVFAWPAITIAALSIVFGVYAFVDGVFLIVKAIGGWKAPDDRWLLRPAGPRVGLLFFIAAWSLATGILEIVGAIRLRKEIQGEVWWILSGVASILFAVLQMIFPGAGILGLVWLLGVYAIVFGVLLIALGIRVRMQRPDEKRAHA